MAEPQQAGEAAQPATTGQADSGGAKPEEGPAKRAGNKAKGKAMLTEPVKRKRSGKAKPEAPTAKPAPDPIAALRDDHRKIEALFASFDAAPNRTGKQRIVAEVCAALKLHAELEEQVFYPATRDHSNQDDKLDEAQVEHDTVKVLIAELEGAAPTAPFYAAKVKVLSEYVRHHVAEEEAPDGILEAARTAGVDLARVGEDMQRLRAQLEADPSRLALRTTALGTIRQGSKPQENTMARQNGNGSGEREQGGSRQPGDRPRRGGGADGFNEASRRAAERDVRPGGSDGSTQARRQRRIGLADDPRSPSRASNGRESSRGTESRH